MSNNQLVLKGQACILAARNAYDLIYKQQDMEKAVECLSALQEDAKQLQIVAEENKEKSAAKEQELEEEIVRLTKEKENYNLTVSRLNDERRNEEYKLSQQWQSNAESVICYTNQTLSDIQCRISDNKRRITEIYDKIVANKTTLAIHRQELDLCEFFVKASEDAAETTQRLEMIIQKAKDKQNLHIIRSNGTITVAKSVVEAWEEISLHQGMISHQKPSC